MGGWRISGIVHIGNATVMPGAKRRAVENYREKRAQAVRMHLSGVPVDEIADQLNSKAARVRGWLKSGEENG